jgi:hypothetical protein
MNRKIINCFLDNWFTKTILFERGKLATSLKLQASSHMLQATSLKLFALCSLLFTDHCD